MMTTKKTMIAEIDLYKLTDKQFHALCELLGEDPLEMGAIDVQPIHVVYSPGQDLTVVRYMKMRQIKGNRLGHILGITTGGTEEPVSSRF